MNENKLHFIKKPNYNRVGKDMVVRLKYLISNNSTGETLEFRDDLYYLHGGYGGAFPDVEEALEGHEVGEKLEVVVPPERGFGVVRQDLRVEIPLTELPPEGVQPGTSLEAESETGETIHFRVLEVGEQTALLDGNHPFAGLDLKFVLEIMDIRKASEAELEAGYAFRVSEEG
jgi:FKBP-type peptidyl-prolyl cis-trans isomerase SlyD